MSDTDSGSGLGPKPDAEIEPGEPNPGGPDARPDSDGVDNDVQDGEPIARDLDPEHNPAVDDEVPNEVKEGEDTATEATESESGESGVDAEDEDPA